MGFWDFLRGKGNESRSIADNDLVGPTPYSISDTVNSVIVNEKSALQLSTVYACVKIISETSASLPKNFHKRLENGDSQVASKSYAQKLFKKPNPFMTFYTFDMAMTYALCLRGNAYAWIKRDSNNRPLELWPIHPDRVKPEIKGDKLYYLIDDFDLVEAEDMLHYKGMTKNGITGLSPISLQAQMLSVGMSVQTSQKDTYEKGANLDGILVFPQKLTKETKDATVEGWSRKVGGIGGARTAILDNDAKYQQIGVTAADKKFLESKNASSEEIARMFNVPLHLLQFPNNQSYASVEQLEIGFVNHCMLPIIRMKEEENERKLLASYEDNLYCKYNLNGLMRGDFAGRMEGYRTLHTMGLPLNRILKLEDMDSVDGGDVSLSPLNMIETTRLSEYHFTANTSKNVPQSIGTGGSDNKKRTLTLDELLNGD